jgi:threonine dehydrogenase-like Zn-dependent dehydrogenase
MAAATMKAVAVRPPQPKSARLIDVPRPACPADGVLARVLEVGIDGTDRELQDGSYGQLPEGADHMILGHESLAVVEQVGPQSKFKPGDLVVPTVRRPGDCAHCRAGEMDFCSDGIYRERGIWRADGYMAEAFAEQDAYLIPISPALRSTAVMLEPVSIAEKALRQTLRIQRRMQWELHRAWIFGAGPLGILIAMVLRAQNIETMVYSREPGDAIEAELIRVCGAEYVSSAQQPLDVLAKRPAPDAIFEATGAPALVLRAPLLVARDGVVCLLGVSRPSGEKSLDEAKYNNEMVLGNRLVFGCVNSHRVDFEQGAKDLAGFDRLWPGLTKRLFTRRLPLDKFGDALDKGPADIKVVLEVSR